MALTRMIFAIQTTDTKPTRVRVSGNIGTPAPAMTRLRREGGNPPPVDCVDGSWTMDLDAGDYIVELQVESERWVPGRLDIVPELAPGQSPPVFVYYGPLPGNSPPVDLVAWRATALYVDQPESSAIGDSKDPWPPPPPPPPRIMLAPDSAAWFEAELTAARTRIERQRAEAGAKGVPAYALDAVTER